MGKLSIEGLGVTQDELAAICAYNEALEASNRKLTSMLRDGMETIRQLRMEIATIETAITTCLNVIRAAEGAE